jgi:NitT/TauT family transport system ATP-binding protein
VFQKRQKNALKGTGASAKALAPGEDPAAPFLEVIHLTKAFRVNGSVVTALSDVSFAAASGEMVCILGRSGCGKTTLLNLVAGFLSPTTGAVLVKHRAVLAPGPDRCVVFQQDALFPWLSVRENIAFGLRGRMKGKKERSLEVDRFLSLTGLGAFASYLPREISGGMKQRVALARVLVLRPAVLLMDEPFASLDVQTREEMQDLLVSLSEELRQTILFVTHDVDEAVRLADRILLMDRNPGRIREQVPVPLPRPRRGESTEFVFFRRKLREILRNS